MIPKFQINDTIECDAIVGWVRDIFESRTTPGLFVYAIEEPESEAVYYYPEEELS